MLRFKPSLAAAPRGPPSFQLARWQAARIPLHTFSSSVGFATPPIIHGTFGAMALSTDPRSLTTVIRTVNQDDLGRRLPERFGGAANPAKPPPTVTVLDLAICSPSRFSPASPAVDS